MPAPEQPVTRADVMSGNGPYGKMEAAFRRAVRGARPVPPPEGGIVPPIAATEHGEAVPHAERVVHRKDVHTSGGHDTTNGVDTLTPYDANRDRDRRVLSEGHGSVDFSYREPLPDID